MVAGALAVLLAVAVALLVAARRRIATDARRIEGLESDLSAALRPRPPATPTERAVSRVLRTVGKVREHGVAGLLQSSIEDLQAWASEERDGAQIPSPSSWSSPGETVVRCVGGQG